MTTTDVLTIPLCEPYLGGNERRYVLDAINANEPCSGAYVGRFERAVAEYLGVRHAVAVSSGSAALHLALLAAGVGPGDEVLVPALTFIATANAVRYCGAEPVFVDVDEQDWMIDPAKARDAVTRRTQAVLPVHLLGHPARVIPLGGLALSEGLSLIEDATEALGASWDGGKVGTFGNLAALSFNGNKLITTGGGGMVVTRDDGWAERVRYLANQATDDAIEHVHGAVGYNYRMSNVQAAIGLAQMERLDAHLAAKRGIARVYNHFLAEIPGIAVPVEATWARSAWWMYTCLIRAEKFGMDSRELGRRLRERGIDTRPLFQPLHLSPAYSAAWRAPCPVAERVWREAISLPCSVGMGSEHQGRVIEAIRELGGK